MRNSSSTTVLLGLLVISALLSIGLFWLVIAKERELRDLRTGAATVNYWRTMIPALVNDSVEYSKKNPAIDPILEAAGVKPPKTGTAPTAKPGTK